MTHGRRAPSGTIILAGLVTIAGAVFNGAFRPWDGSAPLLILGASGAVQIVALTILVLRNWHPSGPDPRSWVASSAVDALARAPVGASPGASCQLANFGPRVVAALIDAALVLWPILLGVVVFVAGTDEGEREPEGFPRLLVFILVFVSLMLFTLNRAFIQGNGGQSWGKTALKLRLVRLADGQPVTQLGAVGRDFLHLVDALIFNIGFLWPLWDERRQTVADKMVRTVVVTEGPTQDGPSWDRLVTGIRSTRMYFAASPAVAVEATQAESRT